MSLRAYLANVRWGQILFGGLFFLLAVDFLRRIEAGVNDVGTAFRGFGLVALLLGFWIYLGNLYRHGLVPDYSLACPHCGGPVNRYSEFCEHCGADLAAEEAFVPCPKCGVDLYEGTKWCPECGARVAGGSGKRGKRPAEPAAGAQEGWDEPVDAVSGFPPERR